MEGTIAGDCLSIVVVRRDKGSEKVLCTEIAYIVYVFYTIGLLKILLICLL
jgi:hypothetical protein